MWGRRIPRELSLTVLEGLEFIFGNNLFAVSVSTIVAVAWSLMARPRAETERRRVIRTATLFDVILDMIQ